tara:strand:+ start:25638 stop:26198 length:561 start_codon:yes stop_codon:yes gene_type:complete
MTLSTESIEKLENILFSEEVTEEALDYFGLHGLICSAVVGPSKIKNDRMIEIIFGNEKPALTNENETFLNNIINEIAITIKEQLLDESDIHLPYVDEQETEQGGHYDACLESWCTGFLEGFFDNEKMWFTKGEDVAAELLLPIMALSGLFESDEFEDIRENHNLMTQFEELIPDQLVDIFLFYHSE